MVSMRFEVCIAFFCDESQLAVPVNGTIPLRVSSNTASTVQYNLLSATQESILLIGATRRLIDEKKINLVPSGGFSKMANGPFLWNQESGHVGGIEDTGTRFELRNEFRLHIRTGAS